MNKKEIKSTLRRLVSQVSQDEDFKINEEKLDLMVDLVIARASNKRIEPEENGDNRINEIIKNSVMDYFFGNLKEKINDTPLRMKMIYDEVCQYFGIYRLHAKTINGNLFIYYKNIEKYIFEKEDKLFKIGKTHHPIFIDYDEGLEDFYFM